MQYPSIDLVSQCFIYQDGKLFWRTDRPREHFKTDRAWRIFNARFAGKEAGSLRFYQHANEERWAVGLSYKLILRSILVWAFFHHQWPTLDIDHKDHNPLNDRIENLRPATESQNAGNMVRPSNNTSGHKGVYWDYANSRWRAKIQVNGKTIHIGRFNTKEEAYAARCREAKKYFGDFACFE
jgi:hypothetical protein